MSDLLNLTFYPFMHTDDLFLIIASLLILTYIFDLVWRLSK